MEREDFLTTQIITYIGNKRSFLNMLDNVTETIKQELQQDKLKIGDLFSGSGIVARNYKKDAELLVTNDMEYYSWLLNECYLSDPTQEELEEINKWHQFIIDNINLDKEDGFFYELYAPKDITNIQEGERCFYTPRNAKYIDSVRQIIEQVPEHLQKYFIAPLITEASIKTNTSGVFKGFHKNKETGIGQFGGTGKDALSRIVANIELPKPVFSNYPCAVINYNNNIFDIIDELPDLDLIYLDPPYNQHPYGSNYFMLNLVATNQRPENISKVSGIPTDWNRSVFNVKKESLAAMGDLCRRLRTKYLAISFSDDGFISKEEMVDMLQQIGEVRVIERNYNTYRGSRNLDDRDKYVTEIIYVVKKYL